MELGKLLIFFGVMAIVIGLVLVYKIQIPFLGKLPGDIFIQGKNSSFYFPIVSCILLSAFVSLISLILKSFKK